MGSGLQPLGTSIILVYNQVIMACRGVGIMQLWGASHEGTTFDRFLFLMKQNLGGPIGPLSIGYRLKPVKTNFFFNSREGFFRKSLFCTFFCINPGFGGPWDKLWIFFLIAIFIMLQKNAFGQKNFCISCTGSKVPFYEIRIFFWPKAFFEALWK